MNKIYIFTFLAISFLSCTTKIRYIGKSLQPTKNIEVFISERSIQRPFEYIGKGYIGGFGAHTNQNTIQKKAEKLGKEKGADAVLITDYYVANTGGTDIVSVFRTDSIANGAVTTGHTTVGPTVVSGYNILYVKYTR